MIDHRKRQFVPRNCFSTVSIWGSLVLLIVFATALSVLHQNLSAEEPRASARKKSKPNRLLLLMNGRIVEGTLHKVSTGYIVEKPKGKMLVMFDKVRYEAIDLKDAYRKQHNALPEENASDRIALARWCLGYELKEEARIELRDVLRIEPNRSLARRMLRRVEAELNPKKVTEPEKEPKRLLTADGFKQLEIRSLANLSPETAQKFTKTIQPILINKCGNAACHSSSTKNEFRLFHVRVGSGAHRVYSERNLATTLRLIDYENPNSSPLLITPKGNHGLRGRPVFGGTYGLKQLAALREWTRTVAKEKSADDVDQLTESSPFQSKARKTNGSSKQSQQPRETRSTEDEKSTNDDDFIDDLIRKKAKDEFDPEEFNQANRNRGNKRR